MRKLFPWLGAGIILVIIFGSMYGMAQQLLRRDANSPQIQLAEDAASALNRGLSPSALTSGSVDPAGSLAPFIIVYNRQGKLVSGSGYLNGTVPTVPVGVLEAANGHSYHAVTWQPQAHVRIAAVSVSADNYYVLSGRSLTEVEHNEQLALFTAAFACLVSLVVLAITFGLTTNSKR